MRSSCNVIALLCIVGQTVAHAEDTKPTSIKHSPENTRTVADYGTTLQRPAATKRSIFDLWNSIYTQPTENTAVASSRGMIATASQKKDTKPAITSDDAPKQMPTTESVDKNHNQLRILRAEVLSNVTLPEASKPAGQPAQHKIPPNTTNIPLGSVQRLEDTAVEKTMFNMLRSMAPTPPNEITSVNPIIANKAIIKNTVPFGLQNIPAGADMPTNDNNFYALRGYQ